TPRWSPSIPTGSPPRSSILSTTAVDGTSGTTIPTHNTPRIPNPTLTTAPPDRTPLHCPLSLGGHLCLHPLYRTRALLFHRVRGPCLPRTENYAQLASTTGHCPPGPDACPTVAPTTPARRPASAARSATRGTARTCGPRCAPSIRPT